MLDEIPIIFLVVQLLINSLNIRKRIFLYVYAICGSWYIYHLSQSNTPKHEFYIFQGSIVAFAVAIFISLVSVNAPGRKGIMIKGVTIFLTGYICWLIDFFLCEYINQKIQFHALWHIFSGISLYYISKFSLILCN